MDIFVKLTDNEPSGCSQVVRGNSRKWDHSRRRPYVVQCAWATDGTGPKDTVDKALYHAANRLHFRCYQERGFRP